VARRAGVDDRDQRLRAELRRAGDQRRQVDARPLPRSRRRIQSTSCAGRIFWPPEA
jgi:hypothetical protein